MPEPVIIEWDLVHFRTYTGTWRPGRGPRCRCQACEAKDPGGRQAKRKHHRAQRHKARYHRRKV